MPQFAIQTLLESPSATIWDVQCSGDHQGKSEEECAAQTHLVFPYRGVYVRHVGRDESVAEANQALFFNAGEEYRISHPIAGGDACLTMIVDDALLHELAPTPLVKKSERLALRAQSAPLDPRTQARVASLAHRLRRGTIEPLEAESAALKIAQQAVSARSNHPRYAGPARTRLVAKAKLVLSSAPARRWTLAEIAGEVGCSPVYLTQSFQAIEGIPLYRYHLRLRLANALNLLSHYEDLTALSLDLGFSSHSHFSAAFRQTYGHAPTAFRELALARTT